MTVLVVDDQEIFRRATRELVAAADGFALVGEAGSGAAAIRLAEATQPDLVLLDVRMPGLDGVETARRLPGVAPDATVILMSVSEPPDLPSWERRPPEVVLVRKQDLSIRKLQDLWRSRGRRPSPA